jgi:hypothetical protein
MGTGFLNFGWHPARWPRKAGFVHRVRRRGLSSHLIGRKVEPSKNAVGAIVQLARRQPSSK